MMWSRIHRNRQTLLVFAALNLTYISYKIVGWVKEQRDEPNSGIKILGFIKMSDLKYLLALSQSPGIGPQKFTQALKAYPNLKFPL